jgi:hypothetical protein
VQDLIADDGQDCLVLVEALLGAETMIVSVPFCAAEYPPVTDEPMKRKPVFSRSAPVSAASDGLIVAVIVIDEPGFIAFKSPAPS